MSEPSFQLKGSVVTTFILELYNYSRENFIQQLKDKISQAPDFFFLSPVVISLEKFDNTAEIDFLELFDVCRQYDLQPMAFKSVDERFKAAIKSANIPLLTDTVARDIVKEMPAETRVVEEKTAFRKSKVINRPVRSGQQVYAEGGDLIILSQVSEGAEVMADGNIHIYGSLRGRALAGIKGDTEARVFCQKLEAELISIAGHFKLSESLDKEVWGKAAQVYLDEQTLQVEAV